MPYSTQLLLLVASLSPLKSAKDSQGSCLGGVDLRQVIESAITQLCQLVVEFQQQRLTPTQVCRFEQQLREELRELGRLVAQWTYQQAEPAVETLPKHVWFEGLEYTRLNKKTPQNVWTLFGQVRLPRVGYRPTTKTGDATLFPLALSLGLVQGATPAFGGASQLVSGQHRHDAGSDVGAFAARPRRRLGREKAASSDRGGFGRDGGATARQPSGEAVGVAQASVGLDRQA
jgi:hypothetical protein